MEYVINLLNDEKRWLRKRLNEADLLNLDEETKEIMREIAQVSNAIQILSSEKKTETQNGKESHTP